MTYFDLKYSRIKWSWNPVLNLWPWLYDEITVNWTFVYFSIVLYAMFNTDVYNKINTNSTEALKTLYWQILVPLCSINNQRKTYTYSTMVTVVYVNMKAVSKWVWRRYMWRYWWSYFGGAIGDVIDVAIDDFLVTLLVWQLITLLVALLVTLCVLLFGGAIRDVIGVAIWWRYWWSI